MTSTGTLRDVGYETIIVEEPGDRVALIRLNRPAALNALNLTLMHELTSVAGDFDSDPAIVPAGDLLTEAVSVATTVAAMSSPTAAAAKEAVNRGMAAFLAKRPPAFTHR